MVEVVKTDMKMILLVVEVVKTDMKMILLVVEVIITDMKIYNIEAISYSEDIIYQVVIKQVLLYFIDVTSLCANSVHHYYCAALLSGLDKQLAKLLPFSCIRPKC